MSAEISFNIPEIKPVATGTHRPRWSVMIPTFNCAQYLRQTLESVLAQDPGPDQMQIEVVDDCSTKDEPEEIVNAVAPGRVAFYRKPKNGGAIPNFNTCIERSRGQLIHILHGDDYVLPNFYRRVEATAAANDDVAVFFARCTIVDENNVLDQISPRVSQLTLSSNEPGSLLYRNDLRTPGVVVRRSFYEQHGGFLLPLIHAADWEMWIRGICRGRGLFVNELLAAYRTFPNNDSGRLARTAENLRDFNRLFQVFAESYPSFDRQRALRELYFLADLQVSAFQRKGDREALHASVQFCRMHIPLKLRARRFATQTIKRVLNSGNSF